MYSGEKDLNKTVRMLLVSDTHFFQKYRGIDEDIKKVWEYGEKHDCDTLVLGGDISYSVSHAKKLYNTEVFDRLVAVSGNHDGWNEEDLYREIKEDYKELESVDGVVGWTEKTKDKEYLLGLAHEPYDLGIKGDMEGLDFKEDILIHGHFHTPYTKIIGEESTILIGMGSTYSVRGMPNREGELHKSFKVLEIDGEEINIKTYDFGRGQIVTDTGFRKDEEGFEQVYKKEYDIPEYEVKCSLDSFMARMMPTL